MFNKHFFDHGRHARLFEKGDFKYVILDLLKDKPSHGYEIIRALEGRLHGFYTPSAGTVYPTLQMLEDMGYVTSVERDGKKIYTITDEGKKFLEDEGEVVSKIKNHIKDWWGSGGRDEFSEMAHEFRHLGRLVHRRIHHLEPGKLTRIRKVVSQACRDIEGIIEE